MTNLLTVAAKVFSITLIYLAKNINDHVSRQKFYHHISQ